MDEYIEREAVVRAIKTAQEPLRSDIDLVWEMNKKYYAGLAWAYRIVIEIPAADVATVVRCKDCKHNVENWNHDELDVTDYTDITCDFFMTDGMEPGDFCSHGERMDDNG